MISWTRRQLLATASAAATASVLPGWTAAVAEGEVETRGLSPFGELQNGPDFKHFAYVNPQAPKGGTIVLQLRQALGNQAFDTFNTLNIYVLKGDGAAGIPATFDSLMAGSGDEAGAMYGLLARAVRISADKLTYRFLLRPEARFHDGSRVTARDVAFSLNTLKQKGHPSYRAVLTQMVSAEAETI
jgi:microcin C transport system substrate-binding protein